MPAKWQKWMPLHIDRFMGSRYVQAMHPSARAGYLYLIAAQWQSDDCTLSSEPEELAALSGLGDSWEDFSKVILRHFTSVDDRLRNDVCFEEWSEARVIHEKRWGAALRTNKARSDSRDTVTVRSAHGERAVSDTVTVTVSGTQYTGTETETLELISEAKASSPRTDSGKADPIEAIYQEYPRKVGKDAALKAISRAVDRLRSDSLDTREAQALLFRRVRSYARSPAGNRGELTPHPATWFNQGRYNDDPKEWEAVDGTSKSGAGGDNVRGAAVGRVERSLGAWDIAAQRRRVRLAKCADEADAGLLPSPGIRAGDGGGLPVRHGTVGGEVRAGSGEAGALRPTPASGPEVLSPSRAGS